MPRLYVVVPRLWNYRCRRKRGVPRLCVGVPRLYDIYYEVRQIFTVILLQDVACHVSTVSLLLIFGIRRV